MNISPIQIVFALFLIAHGLITMSLATVPVPAPEALRTPYLPSWWREDTDSAWPASRLGLSSTLVRTVGWLLWLAAMLFFIAAGLGVLGLPMLNAQWQLLTVGGAISSLALLVLYWHPWLALGIVLNVGLLAGAYAGWFTRWFPR